MWQGWRGGGSRGVTRWWRRGGVGMRIWSRGRGVRLWRGSNGGVEGSVEGSVEGGHLTIGNWKFVCQSLVGMRVD